MKVLDREDRVTKSLKEKIFQMDRRELLTKMGYHNLERGNYTLERFLKTPSLYRWLEKGNYDFLYTSGEFVKKVAEVVGLKREEVEKAIRFAKDEMKRIRSLKTPHIYVDTHFVRKTEPVFVLAFTEGLRNIVLDKEEFAYLSLEEALKKVGEFVRNHYIQNDGYLEVWGKIYTYVYYHVDGNKYYFDPSGNLIHGDVKVYYSKAFLRIGNKEVSHGNNE